MIFDGSCFKWDEVTFTPNKAVDIYILYKIKFWWYTQSVDFTSGNILFGAIKSTKMLILISINILAMILDLMHVEVFWYQIVVGLVKMW